MANIGYIESVLGGIPKEQQAPLKKSFEYVLGNLSYGAVEHQTRATNFQAYWLTGTTSTTANQEFSIAHGLGRTPSFAFPVLPLDQVNSQTVALRVSRAADVNRVYFSSASTNAAIAVLVG
jgi:hypothetical protein